MAEIKTEWELEKYFYPSINDIKYKQDLETYVSKIDAFAEAYKGKIATASNEVYLKFLEDLEILSLEGEKVYIFLSLSMSLDTQNQILQKEMSRVQKIFSNCGEKLLFANEEQKQLGAARLLEMAELEEFKPFKNNLINTANDLKHLLSEAEEKIYLKLSTAGENNLYEELTTSFEFKVDGVDLTEDEVRTLRESSNRETRKEAFKALAEVYQKKQNQVVLGNLYSLVCKDNIADLELRGYQTVLSSRNVSEEVSDETVENLLKNVSKHYYLYHQFLGKKSEYLGLPMLETYDVFAPVCNVTEEEHMSFEEGWKLYKQAIEKVDPMLAGFSDEMLYGGRLSVYPKTGKTTGAYAQYTKNLPEFVLLNWADTASDVTTLAHELGHAFHGSLSKKQKHLVYSTPLILAETASIFNETLMFETLLETIEDKELRKKMICSRLDDIFGTIFRQVAYVLFEKACHESFKRNEPLTFDDYNRLWSIEMEKLYGPVVKENRGYIKHGWSSIPHIFHTPFYCYTYAFGNLISLNLYQHYKESANKQEFIQKYHEFLAAGGSDTPENLLQNIFGMKFDAEFYEIAFLNVDSLIRKLDE